MQTRIPLLDLTAQYHSIQSEIDEAITRVLESGQFILGAEVEALESEVAGYLGVKHGIGVASGTDALVLSLRALDIGPDDEVIVPAYTFFATVGAVLSVGATPIFVDIDLDTYCIDTRLIPPSITSRTKAIIPVHLYGQPAAIPSLLEIAEDHGIKLIEDNAQAFGADYDGNKTGSLGDAACLSFFPSKNLGGFGDGGMVVTNGDEIAAQIRMLRTHGWRRKYFPEKLGYNSRLDALQAAVLRVKLSHVDAWNRRRRELGKRYSQSLSSLNVHVPEECEPAHHIYHLYVIRTRDRDKVRRTLSEAGIASGIYYPQPPYLAEPCRSLGYHYGDFSNADQASQETLAIPLFPEMSAKQLDEVVSVLGSALSN
jgi:dTDP-4-amino-4,6-dideoxygalactose transaminase